MRKADAIREMNRFKLEQFEQRVLLSSDALICPAMSAQPSADPLESSTQEVIASDTGATALPADSLSAYDPAAQLDQIFAVADEMAPPSNDEPAPASDAADDTGSVPGASHVPADNQPANPAAVSTLANREPGQPPVVVPEPDGADPLPEQLTETLRAANGPPRNVHLTPDTQWLTATESLVLRACDTLTGSGFVGGAVINGGKVAPGNSPGIQEFDNFTQLADGSLQIEIASASGPGPGGYDQVKVTHLASLNGKIEVQLLGGFVPALGTRIPFLTFETVSGDFVTFAGLSIGHGLYLRPEIDAASGTYSLVAVQLPGGVTVNADASAVADAFFSLISGKGVGPLDVSAGFSLTVRGVEISGSFSVASQKSADGDRVTAIQAQSVSLNFDDGAGGVLARFEGSGSLILTDGGLAGVLSVTAKLTAANTELAAGARGSLTLILNTSAALVNEAVTIGGRVVVFDLPAGPYVRVAGRDVELAFTTSAGGAFTLAGDFDLERNGAGGVTFAASHLAVKLATGTAAFEFSDGTGAFLLDGNGIAGKAAGTVILRGVDGLALRAAFDLEFNNTRRLLTKTIGSTTLDFSDAGEDDFLRFSGSGTLEVAGFMDLEGVFLIRRTTGGSGGGPELELGAQGTVGGTPFQFAALVFANGTFALDGLGIVKDLWWWRASC